MYFYYLQLLQKVTNKKAFQTRFFFKYHILETKIIHNQSTMLLIKQIKFEKYNDEKINYIPRLDVYMYKVLHFIRQKVTSYKFA